MSPPDDSTSTRSKIPLAALVGGGGLVFLVSYAAVGLSTFIFHVVVSRLLGPDRYGALGALLTVVLVLSVPLTGIQAAVTRAVALRGDEPASVRQVTVKGIAAGVVGMVVLAALSPLMSDFLHLGSVVPVLMLAAFLPPTAGAAVLQGVLIGRLRFTPVAVALLVGGAARLLFGVVLVKAGLGVTGAMLASTLAAVVTFAIVAWTLRASFGPATPLTSRLVAPGDGAPILIAVAGYWVLAGADTFLVRHLLDPHQAGLYAAAATAKSDRAVRPCRLRDGGVPSVRRLPRAGPASPPPAHPVDRRRGVDGDRGRRHHRGAARNARARPLRERVHRFDRHGRHSRDRGGGARGHRATHVLPSGPRIVVRPAQLVGSRRGRGGHLPLPCEHDRGRRRDAGDQRDRARHLDRRGASCSTDVVEGSGAGAQTSSALPDGCDLTIIVPFYNPGARFGPHLKDVIEVLDTTGKSFEVIAVSDGSTDGSQLAVASQGDDRVRLISLPENQGKGTALRVGMAEARGTYVGFIDADGDLPARLIPGLMALTRERPIPMWCWEASATRTPR